MEIKRMYVDPHLRRHGITRQLLARLETMPETPGSRAAILDTGSKQAAAHALYEKCDYNRTAGFRFTRIDPEPGLPKDLLGECGDRRLDDFEDV
ncbi:GNAT family N-acetyltransferase [Nocardia sp. CA-135398]|uniref:GNAT family N-acetyltransferase n=1 Tax=Nocardia sp. CA-135398 TaxID=3239977 RepID=UPI003D986735